MNAFKQTLFVGMLLLFCQNTFAELNGSGTASAVIELDNQHIEKCQNELFGVASKDLYPVILLYSDSDALSSLFMPTYESVATALHSQHSFYRYEASRANFNVTSECLGLNGMIMVPTVIVVAKFIDDEILSNPLRAIGGAKWDKSKQQNVSISRLELINAITLPIGKTEKLPFTQMLAPNKNKHN